MRRHMALIVGLAVLTSLATQNATHAKSLPGSTTAYAAKTSAVTDQPAHDEQLTGTILTTLGSGIGGLASAVIAPAFGVDPIAGSLVGSAVGAGIGHVLNRILFGPTPQRQRSLPTPMSRPASMTPMRR